MVGRDLSISIATNLPNRCPTKSSNFVMRLLSLALMCFATLSMHGCASSPPRSQPQLLPANLRQPCPLPLPLPADGERATILATMVEWAGLYRDCADRHAATVKATGANLTIRAGQ